MKRVRLIIGLVVLVAAGLILMPKSTQKQTATPSSVKEDLPQKTTLLTFPIDRFSERLTLRKFGQYLTGADQKSVPCGEAFVGFHTGDDLETFANEADGDIPVYAIAEGTIDSVGYVGGYGGLIVMGASLQNPASAETSVGRQPVTIYYGHINLASAKVKAGERVIRGQILASLGKGCSSETDGERKHLHLAIHKGESIDVRGYVQTQEELQNWINLTEILLQLSAQEPKNN